MSELPAAKLYEDPARTLFVVARASVRVLAGEGAPAVTGHVQPQALVVRTPDHVYAIDMHGQPAGLDDLMRRSPALRSMLHAAD